MPQKFTFAHVKILAILPRFPYPVDKGDKLRAFHHLKYLAQHHDVYVFALSDEAVSPKSVQTLEAFCKKVAVFPLHKMGIYSRLLANVFSRLPFQTAWHYSKKAERAFLAEINEIQPDVLFYQLIRTAAFGKSVSIPKLLDLQDPMSENIRLRMDKEPVWKRWIFALEFKRLLRYEKEVASLFNRLCIISERDRQDLPEPTRSQTAIVSNGIDLDFYQPMADLAKSVDLVFVGSMSYVPNVEAAKFIVNEILPVLDTMGIQATVRIVGASPSAEVKALSSERVEVTGRVADTRVHYAAARIMVAPMFINTGLQNKILEAAAMGLPVVTTPEANAALNAKPNEEVLIASDAVEFAEKIKFLMQNTAECESIAEKGRRFVMAHFSWDTCGRDLELLLGEMDEGERCKM